MDVEAELIDRMEGWQRAEVEERVIEIDSDLARVLQRVRMEATVRQRDGLVTDKVGMASP